MPEFRCSLLESAGRLTHCWEHTVGSCHAPLALRTDWQTQLRRCHEELGFRYVRFHGLLSDDVGTVVRHGGELLYSFFNADRILDFLLSIGMRPFVELSFMPEALASGRKTVFHYRGNVTPPRDYRAWGELVRRLVAHWADRYGTSEVREWFFEVWNEPNLKAFWTGTQKGYFDLYRRAAEAVKSVDGEFRVGGPATARNAWIEDFLDFCVTGNVPADFVSTHHYPTDALGTEDLDTEAQLARSRRSLLREEAQDTVRRARARPVHYTEWSSSSNPRDEMHDTSYAAAFAAKTALEADGLVESYSFWTFSDIFEENYFPSVPFHGGFGMLNLHGIAKPVYRAFELLHRLGNRRLLVDGLHHTVDAWAVRRGRSVAVLLSNHALPRHPIATETVRVRLADAPRPISTYVERIDEDHANSRRAWEEMGEPEFLSAAEVEKLASASTLVREACPLEYVDGTVRFELRLPPHSLALITLQLQPGGQARAGGERR